MSMKRIQMTEDQYYKYCQMLLSALLDPTNTNLETLINASNNLNNIEIVENITYAKSGLGKSYINTMKEYGYLDKNLDANNYKMSTYDMGNLSKVGLNVVIPNNVDVVNNIEKKHPRNLILYGDITKDINDNVKSSVQYTISNNKEDNFITSANKAVSKLESKNVIEDRFKKALMVAFKKYEGTKYKWNGKTSKSKGLDCSGYTKQVYGEGKINIGTGTWDQSSKTFGKTVFKGSRSNNYQLSEKDLKPGDLIYLNSHGPKGKKGSINHVIMYMGDGKFTHSGTSSGVSYLKGKTLNSFLKNVSKVVRVAYNEDIMKHYADNVLGKSNSRSNDVASTSQRYKSNKTLDFSKITNTKGKDISNVHTR